MGMVGPQVDNLITGTLVYPMLDEYYRSMMHRGEMVAIAEEIKRRYLQKLAKHNKTGNLASTARVTTHRSRTFPDRRWESEFSVGGRKADYADDLEREYHLLASVLNEMGFFQGDSGGTGPTGVVQKEDRAPKQAAPHRESRVEGLSSLISKASRERGSDARTRARGGATSQRGREAVAAAAARRQQADRAGAEDEAGINAGDTNAISNTDSRVSAALAKFNKPGRDVGSQASVAAYQKMIRELQVIQADIAVERGREAAMRETAEGFKALADFRAARTEKGLANYGSRLTHEIMEERRAERGKHTYEMTKRGIPDPNQYLDKEPEPLTDIFSDEELRRFGRDPDAERAEDAATRESRGLPPREY